MMLRGPMLVTAAILFAGSVPVTSAGASTEPDSGLVLHGGSEGTALRSLTIEGEDRIQFDFERPTLRIDFEASRVPGLELGSALSFLNRTEPDLLPVLLASSTGETSPYLARPWLSNFASGALARFRPQLEDVDRWTLTVADSRGETVASFQGKGNPPEEIVWDGKTSTGAPVLPGLTYSYVLEAFDRAGNKRNFVGNGFQVPAYRLGEPDRIALICSGADLTRGRSEIWGQPSAPGAGVPPIVLEAASWLNQAPLAKTPVRVMVTARSYDQATALAEQVTSWMRQEMIGDPALLQSTTDVRPDAPAEATIQISRAPVAPAARGTRTN